MNNIEMNLGADFYIRMLICIVSLLVLLRGIYYRTSSQRETLNAYLLFGSGVYIVSALLHKVEFSMGFAFGLFAIFSMLRYRTESMSIRDMVYLFMVIVVSLVASVGPMPIISLIVVNTLICILAAITETSLFATKVYEKSVLYEDVNNLAPDKYEDLISDLQRRTGLDIVRVEIGSVDYLRDTAKLKVFYRPIKKMDDKRVGHETDAEPSSPDAVDETKNV